MRRNKLISSLLIIAAVLLTVGLASSFFESRFTSFPLPLSEVDRLFDIGVVDANDDNLLDIYTSNHHFRQALLIRNPDGGYVDVLSAWGLDQSRDFPLAELSFKHPKMDKPGLYIYWLGTQFILRSYQLQNPESWSGSMRVNDPIEIMKNTGFEVDKHDQTSLDTPTVINFTPSSTGMLRMRPGGQGLPIFFKFGAAASVDQIFVGLGRISPRSRDFSLAMQDRHGMAWADYNNDGVLDIFVSRGALSGTLRALPADVRAAVHDELLVSSAPGKFTERSAQLGIRKNGCSGRHVRWLDIDNDGLLDLFVNCYDREHVQGDYPKQLYRQDPRGRFHDIAQQVGLALPNDQMESLAWFDLDSDGDSDLLALEPRGIFLYRNASGHVSQEVIHANFGSGPDQISSESGNDRDFDGKLRLADYDADGDIDALMASRRGNIFLRNDGGSLSTLPPASLGLPKASLTADWVDYDNDGLTDLHFVPQGLFRQTPDHKFQRTGLLELASSRYRAAICNWFDLDNDGDMDVVMALNQTPGSHHWWEFGAKPPKHDTTFDLAAYRNSRRSNHWLQIKLRGPAGNPQAIGAQVTVETPGKSQTSEPGNADGAFFSQGHYRMYFGLGSNETAAYVRVRWPDGTHQELTGVRADQLLVIKHNRPQQP